MRGQDGHDVFRCVTWYDRKYRPCGSFAVEDDPPLEKLRQALEVLLDRSGGRAERIQKIFSLDDDLKWERPGRADHGSLVKRGEQMATINCKNCHLSLNDELAGKPCPQCGSMDREVGAHDHAVFIEKARVAKELAMKHYQVEPGLTQVIRFSGFPQMEATPAEPIQIPGDQRRHGAFWGDSLCTSGRL